PHGSQRHQSYRAEGARPGRIGGVLHPAGLHPLRAARGHALFPRRGAPPRPGPVRGGAGGSPAPPREGTGLFHFCVTVEAESELRELRGKLAGAGHRMLNTTDHIVSRSFYCLDPDRNVVEVTWDTPEADWKDMENPFAVDRPYELP
ncbi:MAG: hypothetical protein V3S64_09945, partial [bacterium]